MTSDELAIPYDEMDEPVVRLCRAINVLSGLRTIGSCGGHPGADGTKASAPENEWWVTLGVELADDERPTYEGWMSLEFLAWAFRDLGRMGHALQTSFHSLPPWLNDPGQMLTFQIAGWRDGEGGVEPDTVAEQLERFTDEMYPFPRRGGD